MALGRSWALLGRLGAALGAPGLVLGEPRGGPGRKWFAPGTLRGGPKEQGSDPRGSRGGPRKPKRAFWSGSRFSGGAGIVINIDVSAIFEKITFFCNLHLCNSWGWPKRAPRRVFGGQEASQEPSYFLGSALATSKGALQEIFQAPGGLFGWSWIG